MADELFDYQKYKTCDRRVVKRWDDGELDVVKGDNKQWLVEEFGGKIAGWFDVAEFDTEQEATQWLRENP